MAAAVVSPNQHANHDVMDTRTPSPIQRTNSTESESKDSDYQPDLSNEVAMLSTKLVNAINYQTNLDDSLQQSRHELDQQRRRCTELEAEKRKVDDLITSGVLVKKSDMDKIILKLRSELSTERAARQEAEREKKKVEAQLEDLTTALFEEANNMVAAARKDTEAVEKRNAQLKNQLHDTEMLLASQQEQLQQLKATMEKQQETTASRAPSMPSTPITTQGSTFDALQISPNATSIPDLPPEHPLHFSQLISPVLRSDISAFTDFQDLLLLARRLGAHSRQNSSTNTQSASGQSTITSQAASTSSPNLPGAFSFSTNSSPVSSNMAPNLPPLKDSKFYKRVLTEDIEPCLRLDLAPGLSFLSRRTVLGALLQGTLAVEPYPQNKHYFACTLCGESRRHDAYLRKYRFRTSEDDAVSKPLCDYCVTRLRATCDFVGFLRMVRDGHWRSDGEEDQKSAWEESVRLRERMFWARLGGGVVPSLQLRNVPPTPPSALGIKSLRHSLESIPEGHKTVTEESGTHDGSADVLEGPSARLNSGISDAVVSVPPNATATPELQSAESAAKSGFLTPPASRGLDVDGAAGSPHLADEGASDTEPTTPFEDASQQLESELEASAGGVETNALPEQNKSDEVPATEAEADSRRSSKNTTNSSRNSSQEPSAEKELTSRSSLQVQQEVASRPSLSIEERPQHERKNSSVLARVRAMEAAK